MTLSTLYLLLTTGAIVQYQFSPTTCHILAEHYAHGGHFRVWAAKSNSERWLSVERAVCIETVDVTQLQPEAAD